MSESFEVQEQDSCQKKADVEDVIYRNKDKEDINSTQWSKGILKDLELCKSYVFREVKDRSNGNKFEAIESFTSEEDPKEIFSKAKSGEDELSIRDWREKHKFRCHGTINYKGKEYEYQVNHIPIATITKSEERGYEEKLILSQVGRRPIEIYNKLSNMTGKSILVGRSRIGGLKIRTDNFKVSGKRTTFTQRSKLALAGISLSIVPAFFILLYLVPFILTPMVAATAALSIFAIGSLFSIYKAFKKTDDLYSAEREDWMYEVPESSIIRKLSEHGSIKESFQLKKAEVEAFENGDVKIQTENSTWTFIGNSDQTPDSDVETLFDKYGIDMMDGEIEIAISDNNAISRGSVGKYFKSDDEQHLFITRDEYYNIN